MKEKEFETKIKKFLDAQNCYYRKIWGGGFQVAGLPDLLICCNGFFVAVEIKSEKGKPTELQLHNIAEINNAGGLGLVLYPNQFNAFKRLILDLKQREPMPKWDWSEYFTQYTERKGR